MSILANPYTAASTLVAAGIIGFTLLAGGPVLADEGEARPAPVVYEEITVTAPRPYPADSAENGSGPQTAARTGFDVPAIGIDAEAVIATIRQTL